METFYLLSWRLLLDVADSGCGLIRCIIQTPCNYYLLLLLFIITDCKWVFTRWQW
jgi:hypothetical protein